MKKTFETLKRIVRKAGKCLAVVGTAAVGLLAISAAQAQTQVPLKIYWLTNSAPTNGFNFSNGAIAVAASVVASDAAAAVELSEMGPARAPAATSAS